MITAPLMEEKGLLGYHESRALGAVSRLNEGTGGTGLGEGIEKVMTDRWQDDGRR